MAVSHAAEGFVGFRVRQFKKLICMCYFLSSVVMALSMFLIPLVLCTFATAALSADRPEEKVFQYLFAIFCILLVSTIFIFASTEL